MDSRLVLAKDAKDTALDENVQLDLTFRHLREFQHHLAENEFKEAMSAGRKAAEASSILQTPNSELLDALADAACKSTNADVKDSDHYEVALLLFTRTLQVISTNDVGMIGKIYLNQAYIYAELRNSDEAKNAIDRMLQLARPAEIFRQSDLKLLASLVKYFDKQSLADTAKRLFIIGWEMFEDKNTWLEYMPFQLFRDWFLENNVKYSSFIPCLAFVIEHCTIDDANRLFVRAIELADSDTEFASLQKSIVSNRVAHLFQNLYQSKESVNRISELYASVPDSAMHQFVRDIQTSALREACNKDKPDEKFIESLLEKKADPFHLLRFGNYNATSALSIAIERGYSALVTRFFKDSKQDLKSCMQAHRPHPIDVARQAKHKLDAPAFVALVQADPTPLFRKSFLEICQLWSSFVAMDARVNNKIALLMAYLHCLPESRTTLEPQGDIVLVCTKPFISKQSKRDYVTVVVQKQIENATTSQELVELEKDLKAGQKQTSLFVTEPSSWFFSPDPAFVQWQALMKRIDDAKCKLEAPANRVAPGGR